MADLVAVLRDGELQQLGTPDDIYDRPANRFVAAFVGNPPMNVLEGELDGASGAFVVGGPRSRSGEMYARCAAGEAVAHRSAPRGPRPRPSREGEGVLAGEVYVVEPMGNETLVDVRHRRDQRVMVRVPNAGSNAPIGSPIGVRGRPRERVLLPDDGTTVLHRSDRMQATRAERGTRMTPETPAEGRALSRRHLLEAGLGLGIGAALAGRGRGGHPAGQAARAGGEQVARHRRVRGRRPGAVQAEDHPALQAADRDLDRAPAGAVRLVLREGLPGRADEGRPVRHLHHGRPVGPAVRGGGHPRGPRQARRQGRRGLREPFIDLGYWPPRSGPRIKGFETDHAAADRAADDRRPADDDLPQRHLRARRPRRGTSSSPSATAGQKAGKIKNGYVFRGVKGNPIVTSWYPIFLSFGGKFFDNNWNVTFNNAPGKAAAEFFVGTLQSLAPPGRRRVRLRSGGRGDPRRRGRARSSSTPATRSSPTTRSSRRRSASSTSPSCRSRSRRSRRSASSSTASRRRRPTRTTRSRS